jgi:hypothetical protein
VDYDCLRFETTEWMNGRLTIHFPPHRSPLSTWSSVSVVVSSSPPSRPSPPSTTARRTSAASATYVLPPIDPDRPGHADPCHTNDDFRLVSLPVPPTAVSASAVTPTSCAPRRSSSERFHVTFFSALLVRKGVVMKTIATRKRFLFLHAALE